MHILIVDDDDEIRDVYDKSFAMAGHQVTTTAAGADALQLIREHQKNAHQRFDAVLLDVEMPEMNGWRVLEAIRKMPEGNTLPVILNTAHGNLMSNAYAKMLGGSALLRKPIAPKTILEVISRVVEESKPRKSRLKNKEKQA